MKRSKITSLAILIFAVLALAVSVSSQMESTTRVTFYGLNYIGSGQSIRLAVQNPKFRDSDIIPCVRVLIVLDVYEAAGDGSVRPAGARRIARTAIVDPGEAASFDLPAVGVGGKYVSVTVFATPIEETRTGAQPGRLLSTLSVRESNRTIFVLPAVQRGFDPQPDPPIN